MSFTSIERLWMKQAIHLASRGIGRVEPNPMVGCVIAEQNRVLGMGWHEAFGKSHAEVNAIRDAGQNAFGPPDFSTAKMFVTLEPCCHHGKTPPCTQAIIESGIRHVIVASIDPNTKVDGGGISQLKNAGIQVKTGLLNQESVELNLPFFKGQLRQLPWVIAKWAMTIDGKISTRTGSSRWISCEKSRRQVHKLRGRVDAILVGIGTVMIDDPLLTERANKSVQDDSTDRVLRRVVLDRNLRIPLDARLVTTANASPVIIFCNSQTKKEKRDQLIRMGCQVLELAESESDNQLTEMLKYLHNLGVTNLIIEGGSTLLGAFHDADLLDELHVYTAPKSVGGNEAPSPMAGLGIGLMKEAKYWQSVDSRAIGDDHLAVFRKKSRQSNLLESKS